MAKVNKGIGSFAAMAYSPNGEYVGTITNTDELLDFRCQVKRENVGGYYLKLLDKDGYFQEKEKIKIDRRGTMSDYPDEMDFATMRLLELV